MIARTRKRPRVRSYSFRSLGWLIRREALLRIVNPIGAEVGHTGQRLWIARLTTTTVHRAAAEWLTRLPERRFYP